MLMTLTPGRDVGDDRDFHFGKSRDSSAMFQQDLMVSKTYNYFQITFDFNYPQRRSRPQITSILSAKNHLPLTPQNFN